MLLGILMILNEITNIDRTLYGFLLFAVVYTVPIFKEYAKEEKDEH